MLKGFTRKFKPLEILTEEQIEAIHRGTLDVLFQTGVRIEHKRSLDLLEKNGCWVDHDKMIVRFPPGLVEECLRKCPSSFRIRARDPKKDLVVGGNRVYFCPFPGMQIVDLDSWERRDATRKEYYDGVTILDALDHVHSIWNYTPYFGFEGVPPVMRVPEGVAAQIRNFSSSIGNAGRPSGCERFNTKMAKALRIEIGGGIAVSAPLTFYEDQVEAAWNLVEAGFVTFAESTPIFGGTGPATIAGSAVSGNAESLAAIVLMQLIKPGTRMWAFHFAFPQDMRGGSPAFGSIESFLHQVVFNQMWRTYGIPIVDISPGPSNSKRIDFQCGYEKSIGALTAAISGANLVQLHGSINAELTFHPLQAILDDDVAGMIGRFIEGVEITDETLAIDLINEVGPIPGHYLDKAHTRKWWKLEQFMPRSADRLTYPEWMAKGKKNALDYAKERMDEILATHRPMPLTPEQEQAIEDVLKEAREHYRKEGMISDEDWEEYKGVMGKVHYPYV
jgi:trimethylamine--corrinoid protein Co-methyltransferase